VADAVDARAIAQAGSVALGEIEIARAWNVRGNPVDAPFASEVQRVLGLPLPVAPMTSACDEHRALLWLGPRSWLWVAGAPATRDDFDDTRRAINAAGGALFDVSASYAAWTISGAMAARMLNRGCPLDFHPDAFRTGQCAQSLLGHINALFYRPGEAGTFIVIVARSFAADAWHVLCASARSEGYRIAPRRAFGAFTPRAPRKKT